MQHRIRNTLLRLAELIGLYSLVYPGFMLLRHAIFGAGSVFAEIMLSLCVFFAGVFSGRYIIRDKCAAIERLLRNPLIDFIWEGHARIRPVTTAAAYSAAVVPVCAVSALYWNAGAAGTIFAAVAVLLFYCTGIKLGNCETGSILKRTSLYTGLIITAVYIFIATYFKSYALYGTLLFIFAFIFMMLSFIVQNQSELDYIFIKKTSHSAPIPDKIRAYNLAAVILFFAAVILLINLKGIVVSLIKILQKIAGWIAAAVSAFLSVIMPYDAENPQSLEPETQYPFFSSSEAQNPIWGLITNIVQYFILLYFIYRLSPFLFSALKKAASSFAEWIKRILRVNLKKELQGERDCYYDEVETIAPGRHTARNADKRLPINIKKDLRRIKDPVRKVRYIYYAVLCIMLKKGRVLNKSDTTKEIYDKTKDCKEMVHYAGEVIEIYERVRYGMQIPQKHQADLLEEGLYKLPEIKNL